MKILVIQQKMIGDVLTSSILFEALRESYPNAELHYLIHQHTLPVVENNPFIDRFILFDPVVDGGPLGLFPVLRKIRRQHYEIVIDVYAKINTAIISSFSGASKRISFYKRYTSGAYTTTFHPLSEVKTNAGLAIENRMLLLQALSPHFPLALKPKIFLTEKEKASAKQMLINSGISKSKPLFMISILGSSPEKTYPVKFMARILDFIVENTGAQLLFNYIPSQEKEAKKLYDLCQAQTKEHIFFDVFGKSLREFMAISSLCDALIGNEGGAINMAKALNVPTFAIFSPQIKKENWSIFEDGSRNLSVHLKDYKPELFKDLTKKEINGKATYLYELLDPDLIFVQLKEFLATNRPGKENILTDKI